jgi:hypothetical protein
MGSLGSRRSPILERTEEEEKMSSLTPQQRQQQQQQQKNARFMAAIKSKTSAQRQQAAIQAQRTSPPTSQQPQFWTRQGYPKYEGKYPSVTVPPGYRIGSVKEVHVLTGIPKRGPQTLTTELQIDFLPVQPMAYRPLPSGLTPSRTGLFPTELTTPIKSTLVRVLGTKVPSGVLTNTLGLPANKISYYPKDLTYGQELELIALPSIALIGPGVAAEFGVKVTSLGILTWGAGFNIGAQEGINYFATGGIGKGKLLTPEEALQAGVIGEVGYIAGVAAMSGASAIGSAVWERLPTAVTEPLETVGGYVKSGLSTVWREYLPSPLSDIRDIASGISDVKSWAPYSLLKLVYGDEPAQFIMAERAFGWTTTTFGMTGFIETPSEEAWSASESLYGGTETQAQQTQKFFGMTRGEPSTPFEVTLKKAMEDTLPTGGKGGLSSMQELILLHTPPDVYEDVSPEFAVGGRILGIEAMLSKPLISRSSMLSSLVGPASMFLLRDVPEVGLKPQTDLTTRTLTSLKVGQVVSQAVTPITIQQISQTPFMPSPSEQRTVEIFESPHDSYSDFFMPRRPRKRTLKTRGLGAKGLLWPVTSPEEFLGAPRRRSRRR